MKKFNHYDINVIIRYLKTIISQKDINKSSVLQTIFDESKKPTIFLPNYGEFGSTVHKLIRIVYFYNSPKKIVCCKKGEESLFPLANKFFYDWNDCVDDIHKWGFFSKKKLQGVKNYKYKEYQNLISQDFEKIQSIFGKNYNYIHLWKYNSDKIFQLYAHYFKVKLKPKTLKNIKADIIISPRYRKGRSENNFLEWEKLINIFNKKGYSIGCIGSKEQSLRIRNSNINSWDYKDNTSAIMELLNNCKLYLGLDTGISHLASIMSIPMIVFSHVNQKHYLTNFMEKANNNYFLDLGKNVKNTDIIVNKVIEYMEKI